MPNADYILYVTAIDSVTCRAGGAGAHARTCQSESSLDRCVGGWCVSCVCVLYVGGSKQNYHFQF